jgi:hypothetical protein
MTLVPLGLALLVCGVTWWRLAVVTRRLDRAHETMGHLIEAHKVNLLIVEEFDNRLTAVERRRCAGVRVAERN